MVTSMNLVHGIAGGLLSIELIFSTQVIHYHSMLLTEGNRAMLDTMDVSNAGHIIISMYLPFIY